MEAPVGCSVQVLWICWRLKGVYQLLLVEELALSAVVTRYLGSQEDGEQVLTLRWIAALDKAFHYRRNR